MPQAGTIDADGWTEAERAFGSELGRVLNAPALAVDATVVTVPVFYGDSLVVRLGTTAPVSVGRARPVLQSAPGIILGEHTPSGRPVTTFTLAVSRSWNSADGERHAETGWFNIVAWGNLAEICKQYLVKGQQVYIEGRLQTRRWDDKEGQKHTSVEIVANEMMMLGERREAGQGTEEQPAGPEGESAGGEDEFPF